MSVIDNIVKDYFNLHSISPKETIGVAVSGGADSLCLAYHLAIYAQQNGLILKAVTVDHGLRPESAKEAQYVHELMKKTGVEHTTLKWIGKKPQTRIEEKARQKRYELIEKWCQKNQIAYLFLAHHQGDQSETFWARLARGSGVDGLSAMVEYTPFHSFYLCRPFLNLPKAKLEQDLRLHHMRWCEDAMNQDESYERVRWRHRQRALSDWGLTPDKVTTSCRRLARAREALSFYADRFYNALADLSPKGYFTLQEQAFLSIPDEIKLRVVTKILNHLYPTPNPISLDALERWLSKYPKSATLGGCILVRQKGILFIAREPKHLKPSANIKPNQITDWNGFFVLSSYPVQITVGTEDKELPFAIRKTIPKILSDTPFSLSFILGTKKELEKKFNLDYKRKHSEIILLSFKGKK